MENLPNIWKWWNKLLHSRCQDGGLHRIPEQNLIKNHPIWEKSKTEKIWNSPPQIRLHRLASVCTLCLLISIIRPAVWKAATVGAYVNFTAAVRSLWNYNPWCSRVVDVVCAVAAFQGRGGMPRKWRSANKKRKIFRAKAKNIFGDSRRFDVNLHSNSVLIWVPFDIQQAGYRKELKLDFKSKILARITRSEKLLNLCSGTNEYSSPYSWVKAKNIFGDSRRLDVNVHSNTVPIVADFERFQVENFLQGLRGAKNLWIFARQRMFHFFSENWRQMIDTYNKEAICCVEDAQFMEVEINPVFDVFDMVTCVCQYSNL